LTFKLNNIINIYLILPAAGEIFLRCFFIFLVLPAAGEIFLEVFFLIKRREAPDFEVFSKGSGGFEKIRVVLGGFEKIRVVFNSGGFKTLNHTLLQSRAYTR